MIVSLPMYDRPETARAFDLFWSQIREKLLEAGISAPEFLVRGEQATMAWKDSSLLLSQTCGLPFRTSLEGTVSLVGTPNYGFQGVPEGFYFSCLVVNVDETRQKYSQFDGCRLAFNEFSSQSGWAAPLAEAESVGIRFGSFLQTGSHRASALAIAERRADLAALDVNSWRLIKRYDSFAASLRVLGATRPTPGLPFVTAFPELKYSLFEAIENSLQLLPDDEAEIIGYQHLARLTKAQYAAVEIPPRGLPEPN